MEDARHLTHRYDKLRHEVEAQVSFEVTYACIRQDENYIRFILNIFTRQLKYLGTDQRLGNLIYQQRVL